MGNNRIFYPTHQIGIKGDGSDAYTAIHGVQSASSTTTFNLEQVFELGQLSIYENIEEIPDVEINITKVLDGYAPIVTVATSGAANPLLQTRANEKCLCATSIFDDTVSSTQGETVRGIVESSGLYVGSFSYNFPIDGNFTESVTLVGNDRIWKNDPRIVNTTDSGRAANLSFPGAFDGTDAPQGNSGVNRRQHLLMTSTGGTDDYGYAYDVNCTVLPTDVFGVGSDGVNTLTDDARARLSNISVSVDLSRTSINELGRKAPYFRAPDFPVQVTTEIQVTATSGDYISATEGGILTVDTTCTGDLGNTADRTIRIANCEGLRLFMGNKNRLASVNMGGGDAGGGNATVSYTYTTFSHLTVMHENDPKSGTAAFDIDDDTGQGYLRNAGNI